MERDETLGCRSNPFKNLIFSMRKKLINICLNTRLLYRLAARRIGLAGYEVHQIVLKNIDLIYIPIPKNACTSLKHAMHYLEYQKPYDFSTYHEYGYQNLHDFYNKQKNAFTSVESLKKKSDAFRFAIVREPVDRFLSCYGNRVLELGDLHESKTEFDKMGLPVDPGLDAFVQHLEQYRSVNSSIRHHTRPQSDFLGETLSYLDKIYPFDQMDSVRSMLKSYDNSLIIKTRKSGGPKFELHDLSFGSLQHLLEFYKNDYELLSDYYSRRAVVEQYQSKI